MSPLGAVDIPCTEMLMENSNKLLNDVFETALQYDMTYFG
jgi:hypothetical protein